MGLREEKIANRLDDLKKKKKKDWPECMVSNVAGGLGAPCRQNEETRTEPISTFLSLNICHRNLDL